MDFLRDVASFLDPADLKLLRVLLKDDVVSSSITQIFKNPESAGKYLVILKDRPNSLYIVAKIAESIEQYLEAEDAEISYELFIKSLEHIRDARDKTLRMKLHLLVRNAIKRKINEDDFETAAMLTSEFYDFGLRDIHKKLLLISSDLSESGNYERALKILNLLKPSDSVNDLKSHVLEEWGRSLFEAGELIKAASRYLEAVRVGNRNDLMVDLGEIYQKLGEFENAYEIYNNIEISSKNENLIKKKKSELLIRWGEQLALNKEFKEAADKFNEAYKTAISINDDEISIRALKNAKKVSGYEKTDY